MLCQSSSSLVQILCICVGPICWDRAQAIESESCGHRLVNDGAAIFVCLLEAKQARQDVSGYVTSFLRHGDKHILWKRGLRLVHVEVGRMRLMQFCAVRVKEVKEVILKTAPTLANSLLLDWKVMPRSFDGAWRHAWRHAFWHILDRHDSVSPRTFDVSPNHSTGAQPWTS